MFQSSLCGIPDGQTLQVKTCLLRKRRAECARRRAQWDSDNAGTSPDWRAKLQRHRCEEAGGEAGCVERCGQEGPCPAAQTLKREAREAAAAAYKRRTRDGNIEAFRLPQKGLPDVRRSAVLHDQYRGN